MTAPETGLGVVVLIAIPFGAAFVLSQFSAGEEITRTSVPAEGSGTLTFEMPDSRVELFAEIDLIMDDAPTDDQDDVRLPDALNYAVEVTADGEPVFTRECEAIWPRFFDWSSVGGDPDAPLSLDRDRVQYLGRLENCTVFADPGQTIVVRAHRVWRIPEYEDYMRETSLAAKLPGIFSGM
jgi:hypothetical protein